MKSIQLTSTHLHPEEQPFRAGLELQHIHSSCSALIDPLELTVIREYDQILKHKIKPLISLWNTIARPLTVISPPHILHIPRGPVLPAEVDERVVGLLDVDGALALVRGHSAALQGHLPSPELNQIFTGGAAGAGHQTGEQSSRRHPHWRTHKTNHYRGEKQLKLLLNPYKSGSLQHVADKQQEAHSYSATLALQLATKHIKRLVFVQIYTHILS